MQKKVIFMIIIITSCYFSFASDKIIHFSIDDVSMCFQDLTKNEHKYTSIFQNNFLKYLKTLHVKYDAKISLYCVFQNKDFTLDMVPSKWQSDFSENSDWLKFGYHCYNYDSLEGGYTQFINEIIRITGSSTSIAKIVRLEKFKGDLNTILGMKNNQHGINTLLTADDDRNSYYLNEIQKSILIAEEKYHDTINNIKFYVTDFRFDNPKDVPYLYGLNSNETEIICFTHEWLLSIPYRKNLILYLFSVAKSISIKTKISYVLSRSIKSNYLFLN